MTRKLLAVGIMLCLGGCSLAPKYTRPAAPVPDSWPSGPDYKEPPATGRAPLAAEVQWRQFFTDPRLTKIIDTSLDNNRDLRVAALNVEKARALYRIQRAELLPRLETGVTASKQRVVISGNTGLVTLQQFGINLGLTSWELDFFGRIRSLKDKALEEYFATDQARQSAQILLVSEVANAYLTLASDRENLKLAQSTLESQQAAYNVIARRVEVGFAPELDLRQVQTRVDSARVDVARYTAQVAQDENALNLLAGSPVPADLTPQALSAIKPLPDVSAGMSSDVLLRRPDILQAENLLKGANANIGAARAAFFPSITLTTAIGSASGQLSGLFGPGSAIWSYAPQVVLPVFDARTWSALKVTKVDRDIAVAQYEKAIQSAFREVADALAQRGTLGDQLAAQQSLVEASAKTYVLSNARYEKGIDIYLNVLDAQRSLYGAQQGLIAIRLARLANQVKLYAVLGGGAEAGAPAGGG
jgi:outer membrane protein, multidrug efflux system